MHEFQKFFVLIAGICKFYFAIFICLESTVRISCENAKSIQEGCVNRRIATGCCGIQKRNLIIRISVSIGILIFESCENIIILINRSRNFQSQIFQPYFVDKASDQTICHIYTQSRKSVNMSIRCTAECFHFRIFFKICLQVRHLVQILAEVQEITFSAPFVYVTDIHVAAGQKIRKLVACYHQSQLCFPVSFIEIAVQTDSKAFCILFNICQLCPVIQAGFIHKGGNYLRSA